MADQKATGHHRFPQHDLIPFKFESRRVECGIYAIRHTASGRIYIGSSKQIRTRLKEHLADLRKGAHRNCYLQATFDKYGSEAFHFFIVWRCDPDELLDAEQVFMDGYRVCDQDRGFNLSNSAYRTVMSPEGKERMRAKHMGEKNHFFGKRHSDATRAHLSEVRRSMQQGEENPNFGNRGKSNPIFGKKHPIEWTEKKWRHFERIMRKKASR